MAEGCPTTNKEIKTPNEIYRELLIETINKRLRLARHLLARLFLHDSGSCRRAQHAEKRDDMNTVLTSEWTRQHGTSDQSYLRICPKAEKHSILTF